MTLVWLLFVSNKGSLAQVAGARGEKTESNYIFRNKQDLQSQITYLETNKTCWKLAERDEAKKGTRVHLWWIHVDVWRNQYNIVK